MAKKLSAFEEAFAEARAKGKKTFTFNNKSYGTVTADEEQKRIDKIPSMSQQSGPVRITQGATYPKEEAPRPRARSLVDQGRDVDIYKDVDKEAVLNAGLGLASLYPGTIAARTAYGVARPLVGAAAKYLSKKDSSTASKARDEDPPLFTSKEKPESSPFDEMAPREFKKGGSVKLSEAARRGDGIAIRGRTKGRLC